MIKLKQRIYKLIDPNIIKAAYKDEYEYSYYKWLRIANIVIALIYMAA
jgi:hypothetical protein